MRTTRDTVARAKGILDSHATEIDGNYGYTPLISSRTTSYRSRDAYRLNNEPKAWRNDRERPTNIRTTTRTPCAYLDISRKSMSRSWKVECCPDLILKATKLKISYVTDLDEISLVMYSDLGVLKNYVLIFGLKLTSRPQHRRAERESSEKGGFKGSLSGTQGHPDQLNQSSRSASFSVRHVAIG